MVRLGSAATCGEAGMVEVRLRSISGSVEEADESRWAAAQEDRTGFYGFQFDF